MDGVLDQFTIADGAPGFVSQPPEVIARRRPTASAGGACFHCGEPCPDNTFARESKVFCCQGCLVVHDLLAANGLDQFYELDRHPGVRVRRTTKRDQWTYLDETSVRERLLDFTDGKISRITLKVPAIHCVACVWLLENLYRLNPAIGGSQVNFPRRQVAISFVPGKLPLSGLVALLASIGYEPQLTLNELEPQRRDPTRKRQWLQVGVAGFAFGNIMLLSLPTYLGLDSFSSQLFKTLFGYLSLALAAPVLCYSASDYWRSARLSLRQRVLTLDVPIALGLAALYGQSAFEIISRRGEGYLDSLAGLVFFLLCGRIFQQKTHDRIEFDRDYKSFFPLAVTRKTAEGERSAAISDLRVGDHVLLRHRELIPADGRLIAGRALVDYSFVTGESEPVAKESGEYLYAGGKQIGGEIELETVKRVSQSYLTSLWNHETFRKVRTTNLNSLTNRYSRRFTRIVIAVAVGAALCWWFAGEGPRALKAFTSVLIVACPCALALAAPFALGTAQRRLTRMQVFLKNAQVLEQMAKVDTIVFDKTGTLTAPSSGLVAFHNTPRSESESSAMPTNAAKEGATLTEEERTWVYSLTRHSTHPHSLRIAAMFGNNHAVYPVHSFHETPGGGIEGTISGHRLLLGSRLWLKLQGIVPGDLHEPRTGTLPQAEALCRERVPGSRSYLAIDGEFRGTFVLENSLRPGAGRLLRELSRHCELALLSGDNEKDRERFRDFFGDNARLHFNQSPVDKLGFIRRLQDSGKTVMMVGDGLNDAGALKQSDIGVAVVERAGVFSPASDVILAAEQVPHLLKLLTPCRQTTRIVRFSFGISALYNVVGISVAAMGVLSPLICAILMPLSSVSVVLFACGVTNWAVRKAGGT